MADFRKRGANVLSCGPGLELVAFSFATGASNSTIRDGGGNLVASVTRSATGVYVVTLTNPRPRQIVSAQGSVQQPTATTSKAHANVLTNYSASAGTFTVEVVVDDGAPLVEDPAAGSRVNIMLVCQTVNLLVQS